MHFVQARTLLPAFLPEIKRTHCKFGRFLVFFVGLYFPLNFTRVQDIPDFFPQIEQIFSAIINWSLRGRSPKQSDNLLRDCFANARNDETFLYYHYLLFFSSPVRNYLFELMLFVC